MGTTLIRDMQPDLAVLNLFLDRLGVDPDITTVADRKRVQKAVYLGQRAGVDLGYRFSWYKKGPYSPMLTRDYYSLAEARAVDERVNGARLATPEAEQRLERIKSILDKPDIFPLGQEDWLELLASYDYLRRVSKMTEAEAESTIAEQKTRLHPHIGAARDALRSVGLLEA